MNSDDKIYARVEKTGVDVFDINKNATVADKDVEPKQRRRQSPQNDRLWTRSDTEVFPTNSTPYRTEEGLDVTLTNHDRT